MRSTRYSLGAHRNFSGVPQFQHPGAGASHLFPRSRPPTTGYATELRCGVTHRNVRSAHFLDPIMTPLHRAITASLRSMLIVVPASLSGCLKVECNVTVHADGSGTQQLRIEVPDAKVGSIADDNEQLAILRQARDLFNMDLVNTCLNSSDIRLTSHTSRLQGGLRTLDMTVTFPKTSSLHALPLFGGPTEWTVTAGPNDDTAKMTLYPRGKNAWKEARAKALSLDEKMEPAVADQFRKTKETLAGLDLTLRIHLPGDVQGFTNNFEKTGAREVSAHVTFADIRTPQDLLRRMAPRFEVIFDAKGCRACLESPTAASPESTAAPKTSPATSVSAGPRQATSGAAFEGSSIQTGAGLADGWLAVGLRGGRLGAVRTDGTRCHIWELSGLQAVVGAPVIVGDRVFFATNEDSIACHLLETDTPVDGWPVPVLNGPAAGLTLINGRLCFFDANCALHCIEILSGKELWALTLGSAPSGTPASSGRHIYIGTSDGSLLHVDAGNGTLVHRWKVPAEITTSALIGSGILYVGCSDGSVRAISTSDGKIAWETSLGRRPVNGELALSGEHLVAIDANCNLVNIAIISGTIRDRLALAGLPQPAILAQGGRAYLRLRVTPIDKSLTHDRLCAVDLGTMTLLLQRDDVGVAPGFLGIDNGNAVWFSSGDELILVP